MAYFNGPGNGITALIAEMPYAPWWVWVTLVVAAAVIVVLFVGSSRSG